MTKELSPVPRSGGFTLVELLVSMAILTLLLLMLVSITDATRRTWSFTTSKTEEFRDAREAFESMTRKLSQATLNTYWDYLDANGNPRTTGPTGNSATFLPATYARQSELRFICGNAESLTGSSNLPTHAVFFQAPMGYTNNQNYTELKTLLNTWGYYVQFGSDKASWPNFVQNMQHPLAERYRFRLMELMEPSESLTLYTAETAAGGSASYNLKTWFTTPLQNNQSRVVAENVVALILLPKLSPAEDPTGTILAPSYSYDTTTIGAAASLSGTAAAAVNSKNQLPPIVQVTMVAVDETSFNRFQSIRGTNMPAITSNLFQTPGDLKNSANIGYAQDLQSLQSTLQSNHINYRVFTSDVSIRSAKWSRSQQQ